MAATSNVTRWTYAEKQRIFAVEHAEIRIRISAILISRCERTVEDHARDRIFKGHGVVVVEHFDSEHCYDIPEQVVKKFLSILDNARSNLVGGGRPSMADTTDQLNLIRNTLDRQSKGEVKVSQLLATCLRIARLRNDLNALFWLYQEQMDVTKEGEVKSELERIEREIGFRPEEPTRYQLMGRYIRDRTVTAYPENKELVKVNSVASIEKHIDLLRQSSELMRSRQISSSQFTESMNIQMSNALTEHELSAVLGRIEARLLDYLSAIEAELAIGARIEDSLERARNLVVAKLAQVSPRSAERLGAAIRRSNEETAEDRSHALQSCRRLLESLADDLYPAKAEPVVGADGRERQLTHERYIARLWQYIYETSGRHAQDKVVMQMLDGLGNRLDSLYHLTNKGVHAEVTSEDVDICVSEMFLVVAHLLRLAERERPAE